MPVKLPDVRQEVRIIDKYKKPLQEIRRDVDRTKSHFKRLRDQIKRASDPQALKGLKKTIKEVKRAASGLASGFRTSFRRAGMALGGVTVALGGLGFGIKKVANAFSMVEDAEAAFTPLMGGVQKAKKLVAELNQTAATTPFQFQTLADVAQQLLPSMNGNISETIRLTRMMGDTAGGNTQKMESITRGYNKALLKGKVDLESLNMIAEAGVPIFQQLGGVVGKTGKSLFKDISAGKVSVDQLTGAFEKMTSKGGIFFGGMEIASKTLTGQLSTLRDIWTLALADMGKELAPVLKDVVGQLQKMIKQYKPQMVEFAKWFALMIPKAIKKTVDTIQALRVKLGPIFSWLGKVINAVGWDNSAIMAMIAFIGGPFIVSLINVIPLIKGLVVAFKLAIPLIRSFGAALFTALGPVGWIIAGITALVTVVIIFRKELKPIWDMYVQGLQPLFKDWRALIDELNTAYRELTQNLSVSIPYWKELIGYWIQGVAWFAKLFAMVVSMPFRNMINSVRNMVKSFMFLRNELRLVHGFLAKKFRPEIEWLGNKFKWLEDKARAALKPIKELVGAVKQAAQKLGIGMDEKTIGKSNRDLGADQGDGRRAISGRNLTDDISEIGDPTYNSPTIAQKVERRGGVSAASVDDLLRATAGGNGGGGKPQSSKIELDFKNMPKGVNVTGTGDADIQMNTGYAFEGF